jgi:hypothetical protein
MFVYRTDLSGRAREGIYEDGNQRGIKTNYCRQAWNRVFVVMIEAQSGGLLGIAVNIV